MLAEDIAIPFLYSKTKYKKYCEKKIVKCMLINRAKKLCYVLKYRKIKIEELLIKMEQCRKKQKTQKEAYDYY